MNSTGTFPPTTTTPPANTPRPRAFWILFLLGFCWAFGYTLWQRAYSEEPYAEEADIAMHIAKGHGFATPMDASPGAIPTSWSAPIYPYLMAGVYRVFGDATVHSRLALLLINALCFAGAATALARLTTALFGHTTGILAGLLFLANPILLSGNTMFWDVNLALCIFLWLLVWAHQAGFSRMSPAKAGAFGLALGILALTNAVFVFTYPLIALVGLRATPWRTKTIPAVCLMAGFVLALLPWTLRNYNTFHRVFFVRAGGGFELWLGNISGSHGLTNQQLRYHPYINAQERQTYLDLGEARYFQLSHERFINEYHRRPIAFWTRCLRRAVYLIIGEPIDAPRYALLPKSTWHNFNLGPILFNTFMASLTLIGARIARRRGWPALWILLAGILAVAPFLFTHIHDRYTFPLRAACLPYAALTLTSLTMRRPARLRDVLSDLTGKGQNLPPDGSIQHDHYIYGTPKR